jgi:essential nuclear protein 1
MSKNKNGKLPKPLKVLPGLPGWARLLALTEPENWTANAVHAAVKTFIPSMKPAQAQLFLRVVLLEAIRADIAENKTLKYHYYEALRRALFKPAAVFKGVIFPLLEVCRPV